jgi:hypothetical protein
MIHADYFDRPETPTGDSPIGKLMQKIHSDFPHLDLETIRAEARKALLGIGGSTRVQDAYKRCLNTCSGASITRKARFSSAGKAATLVEPTATPEAAVFASSTSAQERLLTKTNDNSRAKYGQRVES